MKPQRLQRDNEQRGASEHITASLSVAVENAVGAGRTHSADVEQEGRGPVVKSQRHSLGKILGKAGKLFSKIIESKRG